MNTSVGPHMPALSFAQKCGSRSDLRVRPRISLSCLMPKKRNAAKDESGSANPRADLYERLFRINEAFEAVVLNLRSLRKHRSLKTDQVRRFEELTLETRAATNSYLLEMFATKETEEAGRLPGA